LDEAAGGCGELIFIYGFSMAVLLFDRLRSARSQIVEKCRYSTAKPIIAQNTNLVAEKIAVPRTRGSVRRASGFVQIAITPTISFPLVLDSPVMYFYDVQKIKRLALVTRQQRSIWASVFWRWIVFDPAASQSERKLRWN
jgi:hypothetical protein